MTCRPFRSDDGTVSGFVCSRSERRKRCSVCKADSATLLCDFPLSGKKSGQTCDRALCRRCAVQIKGPEPQLGIAIAAVLADTVDYCPAHARASKVG